MSDTAVYFFDDKQKFIRVVNRRYLTQCLQEKEITPGKSELLNDKLTVSTVYDESINNAAYMAVKESDGTFSMYSILNNDDPHNRNNFVGINFAVRELEGYVVKEIRPRDRTMNYVAEQILSYTDNEWRLGYVKPNLPKVSGSFYFLSVKDSLKKLQGFGCEILFKCKIERNKITDKWIEIYDKIGTASKKRFTYGSSALSVVKEQDRTQLYTSLIGRGKGEEVGDGYGRRIEFTDVEWKKSNGRPLDKPAGQNWIEDPSMTELYGIPTKNGKMRKREGVVVFDDIEDTADLLLNTYNALIEINRPLVLFKTEVFGGDDIGNTIQVHRYDRGYAYRARIFSVAIDRITGKVTAHVGDNLVKKSSVKTSSDLKFEFERLEEEKATFYTAEQIAQWQSDIIRGAKGGAFIMMNQQDLGIGDDRTPFCTVWMNGASIETSDHFLVANSEGIGFIDGDFNLDNFHTAWTIDGVFNASFIQAGILSGPHFQLNLNTGVAEFGKGKIMGPGLEINMTTGDVTFTKGSITGPGLDINMTTGTVKFKKGRLESADGKSYLDLNQNDFKLDNGGAVRIMPNSIGLYDGTAKTTEFNKRGLGFWNGSQKIGYIGTNGWVDKPTVKGLVFDLETTGDYMSWNYREKPSDTSYLAMLTLDARGRTGYGKPGIFATGNVYVHRDHSLWTNRIGPNGDSMKYFEIVQYSVDGIPGLGFLHNNYGIIVAGGDVFIKTTGGIYSFNDWVVNARNG